MPAMLSGPAMRAFIQRPATALRNGWHRTPLRIRLVAVALVLVALALALTGGVGTRLLQGYLLGRVDQQLYQVTDSLSHRSLTGQRALPGPYFVALADGQGNAQPLYVPLRDVPLPSLTVGEVTRAARAPFTVGARDSSRHEWRVLVRPVLLPQGSSGYLVVAYSLDDVDSTVSRLTFIDVVVGLLVLAGLAAAGYALVRASLRPLVDVEATAAAIAGGDLSRRVPYQNPGTEVGRLGRALNGMLSQIESAFRARGRSEEAARRSEERMRRFVADAGHELRTPLTSIRGFAELHRQQGRVDATEATRLLRRIEDEATRMGLLVEDLLLLARLDEQRPFERQPVDLLSLAADAVVDARALAPDRSIELRLIGGERRPVVVLGDEPRLRQVVGNLVRNVLTHTPPGTTFTVGVGVALRAGRELGALEVADEGPGLAPEQAERVFERFYRADPARTRGHGGAGLGLSIVAALTAAHGGMVELETAPGRGATFRVLLPRPDAGDTPR